MTVVIEKQMGITESEFLRLLPRALDSDVYDVSGSHIRYVMAEMKILTLPLARKVSVRLP